MPSSTDDGFTTAASSAPRPVPTLPRRRPRRAGHGVARTPSRPAACRRRRGSRRSTASTTLWPVAAAPTAPELARQPRPGSKATRTPAPGRRRRRSSRVLGRPSAGGPFRRTGAPTRRDGRMLHAAQAGAPRGGRVPAPVAASRLATAQARRGGRRLGSAPQSAALCVEPSVEHGAP